MRRLRGPGGLAVASIALVVAGCGADAGARHADRGHPGAVGYPERPTSGLVAVLPSVGTLTWQCENGHYMTQLDPPNATVRTSLVADGRRLWTRKRLDPLPNPKTNVVLISPPAMRTQTWTISFRHPPATTTVVARLRFGASRAQCVVARSTITTHRTPH
jgi:hypothetical protein